MYSSKLGELLVGEPVLESDPAAIVVAEAIREVEENVGNASSR